MTVQQDKQAAAAKAALERQRQRAQGADEEDQPRPARSGVSSEQLPEDIRSDVMEQLSISSDLPTEFSSQATYFAHWAFLNARAQDFVRALEERVEVSFFELYDEYRSTHSDAKENECKSFVRTHEKHKKLTTALRRGQFQCDLLKATVRAFEMRRDMLIQLGAQHRAELEGTDLRTSARKATRIVKDSFRGRRTTHGSEDEA